MPINIDGSKGIRQNTTETTQIPVGTTAQRPASPQAGMIRFNTDTGQVEGYNVLDDRWQQISQFFEKLIATGGTVTDITEDGKLYRVHTFTSDGTFEVTRGGEVEFLVVAGGGGGGGDESSTNNEGAGGGAGGVVHEEVFGISGQQAISVIVGIGGEGNNAEGSVADNGNDSEFGSIVAIGGGGGGTGNSSTDGADGGSGGGGSNGSTIGPTAVGGDGLQPTSTSGGFGNDGGNATIDPRNAGGGGGGAGTSGGNVTGSGSDGIGGTGGEGIEKFGSFYAAGGGGAGRGGHSDGGSNIGGNGGPSPTAGQENTGSGGGGGRGAKGGNGGSGIVLIRYRIG